MLGSDITYTLRWLLRQKASTATIAAMLALGIGANVVVFSLVNALVLRPFPFPEPGRLAYINETAPKWNLEFVGINYPDFHQWRQNMQMFEAIALFEEADERLRYWGDGQGVFKLCNRLALANALAARGSETEARAVLDKVREVNPSIAATYARLAIPFVGPAGSELEAADGTRLLTTDAEESAR